jgi:ATP-dependent RNA helicase RhlE
LNTPLFSELGLAEPILRALKAEGYENPTPIQAQAIPALLANKDLLGIAQTGTGKTAAFSLPILNALAANRQPVVPKSPRVLVLAPTRELAVQIGDAFRTYGKFLGFKQTVIVGGVGFYPQSKDLQRGVDIVVATPGRLLDHMQQGNVRFDRLTHLVLDEADRMLDMGFVRDVRRIVNALPKRRQSMFFSATMPREVAQLAGEMLHDPARVEVTPEVVTVDRIAQSVHFVNGGDKRSLLVNLLADAMLKRVIVFTRTKHGANKVSEVLAKSGVRADAIHGNKSQNARQRALEDFRDGSVRVLVATDIAARGIDVDGITHVINYELPNVPETYVHRIGRTARAGADGAAISFCDGAERAYLRDIERLTRRTIAVASGSPGQLGGHAPRGNGNGGFRHESRGNGHQRNEQRGNGHRPHQHGKPSRPSGPFNGNGLIRHAQPAPQPAPASQPAVQPQQAANSAPAPAAGANGHSHGNPRNGHGHHNGHRNGQSHRQENGHRKGGQHQGQKNGNGNGHQNGQRHGQNRPQHGGPQNGQSQQNGHSQNGHSHNGQRREEQRRDAPRRDGDQPRRRNGNHFGPRWAARG